MNKNIPAKDCGVVENPILIFSGSLIEIIHSNGSEETQQPTQLYRAGKVISLLRKIHSVLISYLLICFIAKLEMMFTRFIHLTSIG